MEFKKKLKEKVFYPLIFIGCLFVLSIIGAGLMETKVGLAVFMVTFALITALLGIYFTV